MRWLEILLHGPAVLAGMAACDFTHDVVDPGYYGPKTDGRVAAPAAVGGGSGGSMSSIQNGMRAVVLRASAGTQSASAFAAPGSAGRDGAAAPGAVGSATGGSGDVASRRCDLSGRWLQTVHKTTDGLGNLQYSHAYWYYEIEQQSDAFEVKKSLLCGIDTIAGGAFAVTLDFSAAAEGLRTHVKNEGRKGRSVSAADGCKIELEKAYVVYGATLPYYLDPTTTLPSADEPAMGGEPGWEDWDGDGNPGITGICSGTITGKVFTASREWNALSGSVADVGSTFKLAFDWDQEPNVMAFDGSPFLGSSAVRAADASLHFVQLARLADDQATGDEATLCKRLVELAPMLTPEAAGM